jgi:hypothetical protein
LFESSEGSVGDDLKPIPDVEREGNGYVAAGENEFHLLLEPWGGRAKYDGPVPEERWPQRPSGKKQQVERDYAWFSLERGESHDLKEVSRLG